MKDKLTALFSKLLLLTFPIMFAFCGDDENVKNTFHYKIDGVSQKAISPIGYMQSYEEYGHEGRNLVISLEVGPESAAKQLFFSVHNWDFHNPPEHGIIEKAYDATMEQTEVTNPLADCLELTGENEGVTLCDGGFVSYLDNQVYYTSGFEGNTSGLITITKCDFAKHIVSGTISAKVADPDGIKQYTITGEFNDLFFITGI